jgi:hypothetical protein
MSNSLALSIATPRALLVLQDDWQAQKVYTQCVWVKLLRYSL